MTPKYEIGQKVIIMPAENQHLSPRGSGIRAYAGRDGKVIDYYWISTVSGEAFYIYTVRLEADDKDIVLHEDEMQAYIE